MPVDCHPDVVTMAKPLANVRPLSLCLSSSSVSSCS